MQKAWKRERRCGNVGRTTVLAAATAATAIAQIGRVLGINALVRVTTDVAEAAGETLAIAEL